MDGITGLSNVGAHLVLLGKERDGKWLPKAPFIDDWQKVPASLPSVEGNLSKGRWIGVVPASIGMVVVDVDTGPTGDKYVDLDKPAEHISRLLGEPSARCITANGGIHLYYPVERAEWTRRAWKVEGVGGGDVIHNRQQVVLYEPDVVASAVESRQWTLDSAWPLLRALCGVDDRPPAPRKPMPDRRDRDWWDARASLQWISPNVGYDDWLKVGLALYHGLGDEGLVLWDEWSRSGTTYKPGEPEAKWGSFARASGQMRGIGTLIWLARQHGAPRR